jgi:hypothetical protein
MMLLGPFIDDFVAEHQRGMREAAERPRRAGARKLAWWRLPLGLSTVVESRPVPSVASRRLVCRRLLACRPPSGHALVGHDV